MLLLAAAASAIPLKIFFALLLLGVLGAGWYMVRHRERFFSHRNQEGDTYASANLRMWLIILVWIHAVVILTLMIIET